MNKGEKMFEFIGNNTMYWINFKFSFLLSLLYALAQFLSQKLNIVRSWVLKMIGSWHGKTKKIVGIIVNRLHKKIIIQILTCLLLAFMLISNSASASNAKVFYWVDDANYPPLIYQGVDGKPTGIFYEIITEAFRRLNISLKVEVYPWKRAQKIIADGKADGMVTVLTNSRKQFLLGSDPILLVREYLFANKNNPHIKEIMSAHSLKEIRSFKIVETLGSGWTKEKLKGFNIIWVPDMDSAFNMLIKERADIFISNCFGGAYFIEKKIKEGGLFSEGYKNIIINPCPIDTLTFRLLIRKDSPFTKILDDFNETIHKMQIDGTIQHILKEAQVHWSQCDNVCIQK